MAALPEVKSSNSAIAEQSSSQLPNEEKAISEAIWAIGEAAETIAKIASETEDLSSTHDISPILQQQQEQALEKALGVVRGASKIIAEIDGKREVLDPVTRKSKTVAELTHTEEGSLVASVFAGSFLAQETFNTAFALCKLRREDAEEKSQNN